MKDTIELRGFGRSFPSSIYGQQPDNLIQAAEAWGSSGETSYVQSQNNYAATGHMIVQGSYARATAVLKGAVVLVDVDYTTGGLPLGGEGTRLSSEDPVSVRAYWTKWFQNTQAALRNSHGRDVSGPTAASELRVQSLAEIQSAFGLPVQALADVLHISRPALYKWLDATRDSNMRAENRQRLAAVHRLAMEWRARSHAPLGKVAYETLLSGRSLLDILKDEVIQEAHATAAFEELIGRLAAKPSTLGQRMARAGFTRRPTARALPSDE